MTGATGGGVYVGIGAAACGVGGQGRFGGHLRMAIAMRDACTAGRHAFLAGRIPRRLYATASSPDEGRVN